MKKIKMKYVIFGLVFILLIIGVIYQTRKVMENRALMAIDRETEKELFNVVFYSNGTSANTYLITLFDSGRLETIVGRRKDDSIKGKDDFTEIRERKSSIIKQEEIENLIRLAEEFTNEQEINPLDRGEILGGDYFRVVFGKKGFEIWGAYLVPEYRKLVGIEDEYDPYICEKAQEFKLIIEDLSAIEVKR